METPGTHYLDRIKRNTRNNMKTGGKRTEHSRQEGEEHLEHHEDKRKTHRTPYRQEENTQNTGEEHSEHREDRKTHITQQIRGSGKS